MEIVKYEERYKQDFINLNTAWITTLFGGLEEVDYETFQNIEKDIAKGAMIFFAVENEEVIATCMTKPLDDETWELRRLTTSEKYRGHGAGKKVFKKCMEYSIIHGAKRLFLTTNSSLKPAVHIYKELGFKEITVGDCEYKRVDMAFEYIVK